MNKGVIKAHIALLIANVIYALNYDWAKDVMEGDYVQPMPFILIRVIGASILFWSLAIISFEKVDRKDMIKMMFCGLFGVAANQLMFFQGLDLTSRIHASIIMVTSPIIVALLSTFILKEKFSLEYLKYSFLAASVFAIIGSLPFFIQVFILKSIIIG